jgi:hypothetical protein
VNTWQNANSDATDKGNKISIENVQIDGKNAAKTNGWHKYYKGKHRSHRTCYLLISADMNSAVAICTVT